MNIASLISELEKLPQDKTLYNSINMPTWHIAGNGQVVLAGSPCPIQTVEHLLHKLKLIQLKDLPSQDNRFRRHVYEDTEVYANVASRKDGEIYYLSAEPVTSSMLKLWQVYSHDNVAVDVALGGPSYLLSTDNVKILANKPYYNTLGINGKRLYLEELLSVHAFTWQDDQGEIKYMNKAYWTNGRPCVKDNTNTIELKQNGTGFDRVTREKIKEGCKP